MHIQIPNIPTSNAPKQAATSMMNITRSCADSSKRRRGGTSARDTAWPGGQKGWTDGVVIGWGDDSVEEETIDMRVVGWRGMLSWGFGMVEDVG